MADLAHAAEGDTDLHGDLDARHWAERFAARFLVIRRLTSPDPGMPLAGDQVNDTEGLMLAWFASAIETGRMTAASSTAEKRRLRNAEERITLARHALLADGYFTDDQVGDDIAPRIIERLDALRESAACRANR